MEMVGAVVERVKVVDKIVPEDCFEAGVMVS